MNRDSCEVLSKDLGAQEAYALISWLLPHKTLLFYESIAMESSPWMPKLALSVTKVHFIPNQDETDAKQSDRS